MRRRVVYTALLGGYEQLLEQPIARDSSAEFICFTDSDDLNSSTWRVVKISPAWPLDPVRSARHLKVLGHPALADFDETMWIDNRILLKVDPDLVFDNWLGDADLALPTHDHRATVADEFQTIIDEGFDDPARVREQWNHYSILAPEVLDETPLWTAILLRRNCDAVRATMRLWMDQLLRYSRRDQLSIGFVLSQRPIRLSVQSLANFESDIHTWVSTSTLKRDKNIRVWKRNPYRYREYQRVRDRIISSRVMRRLRSLASNASPKRKLRS